MGRWDAYSDELGRSAAHVFSRGKVRIIDPEGIQGMDSGSYMLRYVWKLETRISELDRRQNRCFSGGEPVQAGYVNAGAWQ
jgi:hypothetical protein